MTSVLSFDWDDDSYLDATIEEPRKFIRIPLRMGKRIGRKFPPDTKVIIRTDAPLTDFFDAGPMLVVSNKLRMILEDFSVNAEFFPVSIRRKSQPVDREYFCLNILDVVDCLDRERSQFTWDRGFALDVTRLVIRPPGRMEQPLYWISKVIPAIACARDDLVEAIETGECSGIQIQLV